MSRTSAVTALIGHELNTVFNDADNPPQGGVTGELEFRPGVLVPALDNWGTCSLLFLTTGGRWRTDQFPTVMDAGRCGGMYLTEVTVGVSRCSNAFGDSRGNPPPPGQTAAEFEVQEDDKDRLEIALCRAMGRLQEQGLIDQWSRGVMHTQGPEGGTVAVYCTVIVAITKKGQQGNVHL